MMIGVFVAYLVLVLAVGAIAAGRGRSMEGYFLADRKLGPWVTAISSTASSESGWLVIGLVGEAYVYGAKAVWTACGVLLGFVANWYLLAPRLRAESARLGAITIPDFLAARFGDPGHRIRLVGVAIIVLSLLGYVAAQFTATGKAFQGAFGIDYTTGVLVGAAITVLYTIVGGFRAVSWTDLAQGLLMVIGLVVLPWVTLAHIGGPGVLFDKLAEAPERAVGAFEVNRSGAIETIGVEETPRTLLEAGLVIARVATPEGRVFRVEGPAFVLNGKGTSGFHDLAPGDELRVAGTSVTFTAARDMPGGPALADPFGGATGAALLGWVIGLFGIGLGYPGQPHILTRFMAANSAMTIRRARLIALTWGTLVFFGAVVLGNAARVALPELVDPEQAYPMLAVQLVPPIFAGLLLAAIVSAMMSTADSQLLVVASAVARDVIQQIFAPAASERALRLLSRGTVLAVGVVALAVALADVRAVFWFVLFAWSALGAAFGPPLLLALFWPGTTREGTLAGMITGAAVTVVWKLWLKAVVAETTGLDLYELVPAFAASLLVTWVVSAAGTSKTRSPR